MKIWMWIIFLNADIIKHVDQTSKGSDAEGFTISLDFSDNGLNLEDKVHYWHFHKEID